MVSREAWIQTARAHREVQQIICEIVAEDNNMVSQSFAAVSHVHQAVLLS